MDVHENHNADIFVILSQPDRQPKSVILHMQHRCSVEAAVVMAKIRNVENMNV